MGKESRLLELDVLRGLIMVLMAIDHASFFIAHRHPMEFWGTAPPVYSSALSFLTRFVTHVCAPGFFLLMGAGLVLFASSRRAMGWSAWAVRGHIVKRGLILIVLQLTVENAAWILGPVESNSPVPGGGGTILLHFGVLYGLGAAMVLGAFLLNVTSMLLLIIALSSVALTQVLTPGASSVATLYPRWVRLLLIPGHTNMVQVFYPFLPWIAFPLLGMILGRWLLDKPAAAFRRAAATGAICLALFAVVRVNNGFGTIQGAAVTDWVSFLSVVKYPPSLAFVLLTLGLVALLLALIPRVDSRAATLAKPLVVFGQTPLFFYVAHLYLYALIGLFATPRGGVGIPIMYAYWLAGLLMLYPLCTWYRRFKSRRSPGSIWRFF